MIYSPIYPPPGWLLFYAVPPYWALDPYISDFARAATDRDDPRLNKLRLQIHVVAQAWRQETQSGRIEQLREFALQTLRFFSAAAPVAVAWIDLVETLVQDIEQRHGTAPDRGAQKAAEAEAMLRYIFDHLHLWDGLVTAGLQPALHDYIARVSVDAVVALANGRNLWLAQADSGIESSYGSGASAIGSLLARFAGWLYGFLRPEIVLSKEARIAADQIVTTTNSNLTMIADQYTELIKLGGELRTEIKPLMSAIATAVEVAEQFLTMDGPSKRNFAIDLLLTAAEEYGVIEQDSVFRPLLAEVLGATIDAVVLIFNKRSHFTPSAHKLVSRDN